MRRLNFSVLLGLALLGLPTVSSAGMTDAEARSFVAIFNADGAVMRAKGDAIAASIEKTFHRKPKVEAYVANLYTASVEGKAELFISNRNKLLDGVAAAIDSSAAEAVANSGVANSSKCFVISSVVIEPDHWTYTSYASITGPNTDEDGLCAYELSIRLPSEFALPSDSELRFQDMTDQEIYEYLAEFSKDFGEEIKSMIRDSL